MSQSEQTATQHAVSIARVRARGAVAADARSRRHRPREGKPPTRRTATRIDRDARLPAARPRHRAFRDPDRLALRTHRLIPGAREPCKNWSIIPPAPLRRGPIRARLLPGGAGHGAHGPRRSAGARRPGARHGAGLMAGYCLRAAMLVMACREDADAGARANPGRGARGRPPRRRPRAAPPRGRRRLARA